MISKRGKSELNSYNSDGRTTDTCEEAPTKFDRAHSQRRERECLSKSTAELNDPDLNTLTRRRATRRRRSEQLPCRALQLLSTQLSYFWLEKSPRVGRRRTTDSPCESRQGAAASNWDQFIITKGVVGLSASPSMHDKRESNSLLLPPRYAMHAVSFEDMATWQARHEA